MSSKANMNELRGVARRSWGMHWSGGYRVQLYGLEPADDDTLRRVTAILAELREAREDVRGG